MRKKGIIFGLDGIIAVMVVMLFIFYIGFSVLNHEELLPKTQIVRNGYDVVTGLDYDDKLESLDIDIINDSMNYLLPDNLDMKINIITSEGVDIDIGNAPINNTFVGTGKRVFVVNDTDQITDRCIARFWIWLR